MGADGRRKGSASGLYREAVSFNEGFLYGAGCLTNSSQNTRSDWFIYSSGKPVEVDHRLCEGIDDGTKSWLAA
jgi:hypothetical protein